MRIDMIKPGLALLCVFFAVMWLTKSCDKPVTPTDNGIAWRLHIDSLNRIISNRDTVILHVRQKKALDSVKNLEAVNRLKMREASLVRRLKAANADIQVIADSVPKVRRYVELADSTIAVKDSLYTQAVNHTIALEQFYKLETAALAQKNVIQVKISDDLMTRVTDLKNQNGKLAKRLERKKGWNNFWKGLAGGTAAAAAVVILSNQ